jgi:hypothetical protein
MNEQSRQQPVEAEKQSIHRFSAEGYAPFIKAPRGCTAQWDLSENIHLAASGGLVSTPARLATIGSGAYRITPLDTVRIRVEYSDPVYLLKYEKLHKTIRNRFDFVLDLGAQRQENLWPYLFDFFMKTGEWPLKRREYARIFRELLHAVDAKWNQASPGTGLGRNFRARVASAVLTRVDKRRSADRIAADAGHITHQLISSEHFSELLAEAEMIRSIPNVRSVVPLAAESVNDEMSIKIPFELAQPKRIMIFGAVRVDYRWEYGEFFDRTFLCTSLELYPTSPFVLDQSCRLRAPRAHVPLDEGTKKVYGIVLDAPMICKSEGVKLEVLKPRHRLFQRRRQNKSSSASDDPANLQVRFHGTEA